MGLSNVGFKVFNKVDDGLGKVLNGVNRKIACKKVPQKLAEQLSEVGVNVAGKNARRTVLAAMDHNMQKNVDSIATMGVKFATVDPSPGLFDAAVEVGENLADTGLLRNTSLAKAADNSRDLFSFRHENLPTQAQEIIRKYMHNPKNVLMAYQA